MAGEGLFRNEEQEAVVLQVPLEVAQHVVSAQVMREYANNKMKEAKRIKTTAEWGDSKDVLVADYCQNLALPHQGMTQPGDTYFSPLTVNCFGTAAAGFDKPQMQCEPTFMTRAPARKAEITLLRFSPLPWPESTRRSRFPKAPKAKV